MPKATPADALAAMRDVPLFSAVDDEGLRKLFRACRTVSLRRGAQVFSPTEPAERFYVILTGKVKVYQLSVRGDEQILHLYGPGETFGEAAMWAGIRYPAHAECLADSLLLVVPRSVLKDAIAGSAELALEMMAGMSAKLHEFNRLIEQLSLKEVPQRLAQELLRLSRQAGSSTIRLKQTKRELSAQLGTVAETLSRALGKLKTTGLIRVHGSKITILDAEGLAELASG